MMTQDFESPFLQLSHSLLAHGELWQSNAFRQIELPWQAHRPRLSDALLRLTDAELAPLEQDPSRLHDYLTPYLPALKGMAQWPSMLASQPAPLAALGADMRFFSQHIPGRKWQQIQYFQQAAALKSDQVLDWCCGKGHLGRYIAEGQAATVDGLEWDQNLVVAGNKLAQNLSQGQLTIAHCDVLSPAAEALFNKPPGNDGQTGYHVVALHACGDLHRRLLALSLKPAIRAISLAPCCYQKITASHHRFLSAAGIATGLELRRQDLHTIVQETVTAPIAVQKKRIALQQWRLGFDLLQRDVRGEDEYLNTPSLPQSSLQLGFESFCRLLAERRQLPLPQQINWDDYQQRGEQRFDQARRLDLVRLGFRRALELTVLLDQALFLREQGFKVALHQFCPRKLSPRNLLINAWRD